ncbi:hypothetical protein D1872_228370 [compost metagenome]
MDAIGDIGSLAKEIDNVLAGQIIGKKEGFKFLVLFLGLLNQLKIFLFVPRDQFPDGVDFSDLGIDEMVDFRCQIGRG